MLDWMFVTFLNESSTVWNTGETGDMHDTSTIDTFGAKMLITMLLVYI